MKRLIYQVCLGKKSRLYEHCINSVKEYCKIYNIDHFVQTIPKLRIKPDIFSTNRSVESYEKHGGFLPIYEKENAFSYLPTYDQIAIIDADVWVRPNSPNVFDSLSSAYDAGFVCEREMPITETMPTAPISPYALNKLVGEQYCFVFSKCYGLETVNLRYFNVYGERQAIDGAYATVVGIFLKQKQDGHKLTVTNDGTQRRDFTYVQDVVEANILASTSEKVGQGEVINIGRGSNYSVNEIAEIIGGETDFIGDRLEPYETLADNTKAKELLGWEPKVDIKEWLSS